MMTTGIVTERIFNSVYIWAFLLCCLYLWIAAYTIALRRIGYTLLSIAICGLCFFEVQIAKYAIRNPGRMAAESFFRTLADRPAMLWLLLLLVFSICGIILIINVLHWRKNHITPMSIKDCGDGHPAGIVFWNDRGRVLFSNAKADHIAVSLLGVPVLNGTEFYRALGENPLKLPDGSIWSYHHNTSLMDHETLHELIFTDITDLYGKTEELKKDTLQMQKMNEDLRRYNLQLETLVRSREVLKAKLRIHDEMNHLLMATGRAFEEGDRKKQDDILRSWENNTILLSHEQGNEQGENILENLRIYGDLLGIKFVCERIPEIADPESLRLLVISAREAMNNAVKHGAARHLYAEFNRENGVITATFANDGNRPANGRITPSGGLLQLRSEAGRFGGSLQIETKENFKLIITIPLEGENA